jgi:hypothetical protein
MKAFLFYCVGKKENPNVMLCKERNKIYIYFFLLCEVGNKSLKGSEKI